MYQVMNPFALKAFESAECSVAGGYPGRSGQARLTLQSSVSGCVLANMREGVLITDAHGIILEINDAFSRITGYPPEEVLGKTPRLFHSGRHGASFYRAMWDQLLACGHWSGEIWNRNKQGDIYPGRLSIHSVYDPPGRVERYVGLLFDIRAQKAYEQHLEHITNHDPLTGLPNRVLLADRLRQGMAQVRRRCQRLAVVYLDLDGFKVINDTHGHDVGDQLLIALAARLGGVVRQGDTLARLGGDELVAVLMDLDDEAASRPLLERLLTEASRPFRIGDRLLQVSASLGVTYYPQTEVVDADHLIRQADQAMCQAKLTGKNRSHRFDAELATSLRIRHADVARIREGMERRELVLFYQPKVNMRTGEVFGAEALIRWQHPQRGLLSPLHFLPLLQGQPLAVELGEWVIARALEQLGAWHAQGCAISVSVNVGACQLQQPEFVDRLEALLARHPRLPPGALELEVLESSALHDLETVSALMHQCRALGVELALDDFGTGYSSLTYLKRLPATSLKIDQTFVRDMLEDPDDLSILEGVLGLAAAFQRHAVAEGVETLEHGRLLLQLGCELAQGYEIAPPMPAARFVDWAQGWRTHPEWRAQKPVDRDDLPIVFAQVEHAAWIRAVDDFVRRGFGSLPPIDRHQCRFGRWLDREVEARHRDQAVFRQIDATHERLHEIAALLLVYRAEGRHQEMARGLEELHAVGLDLRGRLTALTTREALA